MPVSLDDDALQRKLVGDRRGGYCFEHNLLFKAALEALGLSVDLMLARVRFGAPAGTIRPRNHLLLRVHDDGAVWHADVGFGAGSLTEPVPFGPGGPYDQDGWRFRIVQDGPELVLQSAEDSGWTDDYGLIPEVVPWVDVETSNWFTATYPQSPFVTGLLVELYQRDGTWLCLSDLGEPLALTDYTPEHKTVTPVARDSIPELLESRFGLRGFGLDENGHVIQSASEQ